MVTCPYCRTRLAALELSGRRADSVFAVGNPARPSMGHAFFFDTNGRTALCIAKRLEVPA